MAQPASMSKRSRVALSPAARTRFGPGPGAPSRARRFARDVLTRRGADEEALERADLLVSVVGRILSATAGERTRVLVD